MDLTGKTAGAPLTDVSHWASTWDRISHSSLAPDGTFDPVLSKVLPVDASLSALEIGCYPGNYMVYLSRRFGYRVSGLDFMTDVTRMRPLLEQAGARVDDLIEADFLKYSTDKRWDVVSSFGFVEHFEDLEFVLDQHLALVAPGGYLVVEVPHFRSGQYLLRRAFQPRLLDSHNLEAMRPEWYRQYLYSRGLDVAFCDYFRTFEFWISPSGPVRPFPLLNRVVNVGSRWLKKGLEAAQLGDVPNSYFSPYVVVVARKPA